MSNCVQVWSSVFQIGFVLNSLWPSDAIWWQILVNTSSCNGLLPYSTEPLPEPMLTYHHCSLTLQGMLMKSICGMFEVYAFWFAITSARSQWVNTTAQNYICHIYKQTIQYKQYPNILEQTWAQQWNLYNETGKVLLKTQKFHHFPGTVFKKSYLFSLSWKTSYLDRPQNLVVAI